MNSNPIDATTPRRYMPFTRDEWARLRESTPLTLSEADLERLRGLNEPVSVTEVVEIYLPLSRLLNLHVAATQGLHAATAKFLGTTKLGPPYIIGVAGSVAVGKSTTSRLLRALLARWPDHPRVDLVTTDGFLLPNAELQARGLMKRKGFPESYDLRRLVQFVSDIKSGVEAVRAPVYSHTRYDIVEGEYHVVTQPDILILEGLNVLQSGNPRRPGSQRAFVSDFFDFSIYVDADERDIESWYVERFMTLRETVFRDPDSYFSHYAALTPDEAREVARGIWSSINLVNLRENILPTRERAHQILDKGGTHAIERVLLRRL
ncbi:MAG: type I pantothenate kinase [Vicinamibacterales bacterium]